jgi:sarcosine oxidase/L-pipecolate oxidase
MNVSWRQKVANYIIQRLSFIKTDFVLTHYPFKFCLSLSNLPQVEINPSASRPLHIHQTMSASVMDYSYIIVGSGVFGASTALELARSKPDARIVLVDEFDTPNPAGASSDLNKIIRADYRDPMYARLAVDAMKYWKCDPIFAPHFHETGMLFAESEGKGPASLQNLENLGAAGGAKLMTVDEACSTFPALKSANWSGVKTAYYNPSSGWAEADAAMISVLEECQSHGVESCRAKVAKLCLRQQSTDSGSKWICDGIITAEGAVLRADRVLLCTGAATAKLIADSAPGESMLQTRGRLVAAAALQCFARVTPEKWAACKQAPVFANLMSHTAGNIVYNKQNMIR